MRCQPLRRREAQFAVADLIGNGAQIRFFRVHQHDQIMPVPLLVAEKQILAVHRPDWRPVLRGLLDGRHRFELRATPTGTTFVQHETFTGVLLPFFAKGLERSTPAGFELMNQALKERAEKLHGGAAI